MDAATIANAGQGKGEKTQKCHGVRPCFAQANTMAFLGKELAGEAAQQNRLGGKGAMAAGAGGRDGKRRNRPAAGTDDLRGGRND
jgi:hypothetical protein